LMDEALAQSPSLDAAAARVRAAQAYTGTARSALFPQIDGSGDISYQHFSENWIYPPPYGGSSLFNSTLRVNGSYELDFWGKNRAALRAALSQQAVAEAEQQSIRLMLTSNIAKSYVELDRLFAARDVLRQPCNNARKYSHLHNSALPRGSIAMPSCVRPKRNCPHCVDRSRKSMKRSVPHAMRSLHYSVRGPIAGCKSNVRI